MTARKAPKAPKYWVLTYGGYPDTRADYMPADNKQEVYAIAYGARFNGDGAGAHVFKGTRSPWEEIDPYPHFTLDITEYGKYVWNRS